MLRKYGFGLILIIILLISFFITLVIPENILKVDKTIQAFLAITGWVLFVLQYLYTKSENFYIMINNIRLWLTNETTKWNFTIDLNDYKQQNPIDMIWKTISNQYKQATNWHVDDYSLIINMPGYTIRVFISEEKQLEDLASDNLQVICVQFSNLELPYRTYRLKIENEIIPLAKDIVDVIQPKVEKYVAKISFMSTNPYFGFFVRKLDLPNVVSFNCDLLETSVGGHKHAVTVRKDRIEIVTNDLLALHTLSNKYIALSGGREYAS